MKHILLTSFFVFSMTVAQAAQARTRAKMLVMGDSWMKLSCIFLAFDPAFNQMGLKVVTNDEDMKINGNKPHVKVVGCGKAAKMGAHAEHFTKPGGFKNVNKLMDKHKDIDVVYLSIGGNELMTRWNKNMSDQEAEAVLVQIRIEAEALVKKVLAKNKNVKVLVTGYDYSNFVDYTPISAYKDRYEGMGSPTQSELNRGLVRFSAEFSKIRHISDRVEYIHHAGVMHYYDGQSKYGVRAKTTTPPWEISTADRPESYGGVLDIESDRKSMLHLLGFNDAFHLSPKSYRYIFMHSVENYLEDWIYEAAEKRGY